MGPAAGAGGDRVLTLLIREGPATEVTVATRILAHLGLLAADGRVAMLVGSEVMYVGGRGASAATLTPYDVCALRLADGIELAGAPPAAAQRYRDALRADRSARAAALVAPDDVVTAPDVVALVERLSGAAWAEAEGQARAAGALLGAYPAGA